MSNEALISFTGNATADAEIRFRPNGDAVANFTVAVTPREKVDGQWVDGQAAFYRVAAWKQLGENAGESVKRGTRVTVVGTLKPREYEHNGVKRLSLDVTADSVALDLRFATATAARSQGGGQQQSSQSSSRGQVPQDDPWGSAPSQQGFGQADEESPF